MKEQEVKSNQKTEANTKSDKNRSKKGSQKKVIIIAAAVVLLIAAVVSVLYLCGVFTPKIEPSNGVVGKITDDWDPGVEEPSDAKSGTQIPGYSSAEMKAGDTALTLSIGNPKENKVGFFASLVLEDGTVLYESPLLEPGQGLTEVPLSQTLEKGVYNAKVVYQCVALDEAHMPLNSAESGFTLIVN